MHQGHLLNPLIRLDCRAAADECLRIAAGQEKAGIKSAAQYWASLAEEIEAGRYADDKSLNSLLEAAPFLRSYLR
jgi:hypothetical protein